MSKKDQSDLKNCLVKFKFRFIETKSKVMKRKKMSYMIQ